MENPSVPNLRSRSRSKTPFLQSSSDRETFNEVGDHVPSKPGRKTPVNVRNTPTNFEQIDVVTITEDDEPEIYTSPPAHRTRNATKQKSAVPEPPAIFTSDYSSGETEHIPEPKTPDYISTEVSQNIRNYTYEYERITTSNTSNGGFSAGRRSRMRSSLSGSDHSNESFAESVLADSSRVEGTDHLPYRLYKNAIEYWNKYPKTDYTYSRLSKDRVELAPGQVAVPNMSRPSLGRHGSSGFSDSASISTEQVSELRRRWESNQDSVPYSNRLNRYDSYSDLEYDETETRPYTRTGKSMSTQSHWWITTIIISMWTSVVSTTSMLKTKLMGHTTDVYRYPYGGRTSYSSYSQSSSWFSTIGETAGKRKWWLIIPLLLLIPFLFWLYAIPFLPYLETNISKYYPEKYIANHHTEAIVHSPAKFELTDDLLRKIVTHVREHISSDLPTPQIIEKYIEQPSSFDPLLLAQQQELIDKLYLEIEGLKVKLAENQNIDEQIALLSSEKSRDMLVQAFALQTKKGSPVTNDDIKAWLQREVITKEELDVKIADIKQSVSIGLNKIDNGVKSELKTLQNEMLLKNTGIHHTLPSNSDCQCDELVNKIVKEAIAVYDADKTGLVDYALESAGGQVISTRCSESYQTSTAVYSLFGIPLWYPSNSPRAAITPGAAPGECWAFQGFPGYLVIKLYSRIQVTGFTMEHTPRQLSPHGQIESAPKKFTVLGLQDEMDQDPIQFGIYEYLNDSTPIQYFPVKSIQPAGHELIELRIETNHGNPVYTCLYRFRVHGDPLVEFTSYGTDTNR